MIDPALTSDPGRPVWARNGLVATGQPLATAAGLAVALRVRLDPVAPTVPPYSSFH